MATTYRMKDIVYPVRQHMLLEEFLQGTENVAMMFSVKWKRPYEKSVVVSRGNDVYGNLSRDLKDIIQQLTFNTLCEFKKKKNEGKLITVYHEGYQPTTETPDPRGMMAYYSRYDAAKEEDDYYITYGDTGKPAFRRIINEWTVGVGAGELIGNIE
jgi:hypothetical protein